MTKHTLILDSSQIQDFLECPRYWAYRTKDKLIPIGTANRPMNLGTLGHKLLEVFYKSRAYDISLVESKTAVLTYLHSTEGLELITRLELPKNDVQLVLDRIEDYILVKSSFELVPLSPNHVEVGFSEKVYEDDDYLFVLEGKIDLIGTYRGSPVIVDHKFHMRATTNYTRSIQFRNYAMVGTARMLLVNHIVFSKNTTLDTYRLDTVTFPPDELDHWREELISIYFEIADKMDQMSFGQACRNRSRCSGKYGRECEYTTLCNEYEPELRAKKQEQLYTIQEEVWQPWI